jgi:hypothetical protein
MLNTAPYGTNFGTNFGPPGVANPYGLGNTAMVRGNDPNAALSQTVQNALFGPTVGQMRGGSPPGVALSPAQIAQINSMMSGLGLGPPGNVGLGGVPGPGMFGPTVAQMRGNTASPYGNMPSPSVFGQPSVHVGDPVPGPGGIAVGTPNAPTVAQMRGLGPPSAPSVAQNPNIAIPYAQMPQTQMVQMPSNLSQQLSPAQGMPAPSPAAQFGPVGPGNPRGGGGSGYGYIPTPGLTLNSHPFQ